MIRFFALLLCLHGCDILSAQDPFTTHFFGNEAAYNPALVGQRGAASITAKAKTQWNSPTTNGYHTYQLMLEESLPVLFFDYGLFALQDTESHGLLRTRQFGGMLAAPLNLVGVIPTGNRKYLSQLNLGIGMQWGQQSVDFTRLVFYDQIDPKYGLTDVNGLPLTSSFIPPENAGSNWYFLPSFGGRFRFVLDLDSRMNYRKSIEIQLGGAYHNSIALGEAEGQSWSVLGTMTPAAPRYNFFARVEYGFERAGRFYGIRPQVFYQRQRSLDHLEIGADLTMNRVITLGSSFHYGESLEGYAGTNWMSYRLETAFFSTPDTRIDLGFAYSTNVSGLQNQVSGIFEATARISLNYGFVTGGKVIVHEKSRHAHKCPSKEANKNWENIWYKSGDAWR